MIVNMRGTSGSGKTTIVRRVMDCLGPKVRVRANDRKKILAYICPHPKPGEKSIAIIGSYENPTGGCDTLPDMDVIFSLVRDAHHRGLNVLFEGLLISADQKRTLELHTEGYPLKVFCLEMPIEVCVESVNMRRRAKRGDDAEPVNPRNTEAKWHQTRKAARWLQERGVDLTWGDRDQVLAGILQTFNLTEKEDVPHLMGQEQAGEAASEEAAPDPSGPAETWAKAVPAQ